MLPVASLVKARQHGTALVLQLGSGSQWKLEQLSLTLGQLGFLMLIINRDIDPEDEAG